MNFNNFYFKEDESILDNPNFKKWFGHSKVVDKNGNPLVMYYGSYYDFNEFDKNKRGQSGTLAAKKAFWFTSSLNHATNFSGGSESLVKPAYLKIENPIVYDAKDIPGWNTQWLHSIRNEKVQTAIRKGKDGVIFKNMHDLGGPFTIVAVFEPNQIKSTKNKGTFDSNSNNIFEDEFPKINVSLDDLILVKKSVDGALDDFQLDKKSMTKEPIDVWKVKDKYLIVDGWHRFVEEIIKGKDNFDVYIVGEGYSDYYKTDFRNDEVYNIDSLKQIVREILEDL
jgi:hypothetical protein